MARAGGGEAGGATEEDGAMGQPGEAEQAREAQVQAEDSERTARDYLTFSGYIGGFMAFFYAIAAVVGKA